MVLLGEPDPHSNTMVRDWLGRWHSEYTRCLRIRYPYTQELLQPSWILRRGSVPYGTDPMRIWGLHKNSWIRIRESESGCICITFGAVHRSGSRPDPGLFAFPGLMNFWRVRIRRSGSGFSSHSGSFRKFLLRSFDKIKTDSRLPLWI